METSRDRLHEIVELLINRTVNGELVWSEETDTLYSADLTKENGRSLKVFINQHEIRRGQNTPAPVKYIFTARYFNGDKPAGDAILVVDTGFAPEEEHRLLRDLYYHAKNSASAPPEALDKLLEVLKT